jgi:hypothetical protein
MLENCDELAAYCRCWTVAALADAVLTGSLRHKHVLQPFSFVTSENPLLLGQN